MVPPGFRTDGAGGARAAVRHSCSRIGGTAGGATASRLHTAPPGSIRRSAIVALPPVRDSLSPAAPWRRGRCLWQESSSAGTLPDPRLMRLVRSIAWRSRADKRLARVILRQVHIDPPCRLAPGSSTRSAKGKGSRADPLRWIDVRAHFRDDRGKRLGQQVPSTCLASDPCKVLPSKASHVLHGKPELLGDQVLHPPDPARNRGRWITVANIAFDEHTLRRDRATKPRLSSDG